MSDNLPDIHASESDADDHTLERSDISPDIHVQEINNNPNGGVFASDISPDIHTPERSSTCNNQESILKKAKLIRNFGITSFSFMGVIILLIIIDIIVAQSSTPNYPNSLAVFSMSITILVVDSIFSIANLVFMILAIVKIANTDWGSENLNKCKKAFWVTILCCICCSAGSFILLFVPLFIFLAIIGLLLSLPLGIVPPIMCVIWGKKVKNTYSTDTKA